nr:hypothetical protein Itr_chr14CG09880 [Ipomoea trifida]GLL46333.1 hypothetical protein Itr_chr14CG09890 [Ipomoea trifida]
MDVDNVQGSRWASLSASRFHEERSRDVNSKKLPPPLLFLPLGGGLQPASFEQQQRRIMVGHGDLSSFSGGVRQRRWLKATSAMATEQRRRGGLGLVDGNQRAELLATWFDGRRAEQ